MLTQREPAWEHSAKSYPSFTGMEIIAWFFLLNAKCATIKISFSIVFYFPHLKSEEQKLSFSMAISGIFRFLKSESSLLLHVTFGKCGWDLKWGKDCSKLFYNAMSNQKKSFKNLIETICIPDLTLKFEIAVHLQISQCLPLQKCRNNSSLTPWNTISEFSHFVRGRTFPIIGPKDSNFLLYTV